MAEQIRAEWAAQKEAAGAAARQQPDVDAARVRERVRDAEARMRALGEERAALQAELAKHEADAARAREQAAVAQGRTAETMKESEFELARLREQLMRAEQEMAAVAQGRGPATGPQRQPPGPGAGGDRGEAAAAAGASPHLDLVTLATSYADAVGDVQVAQARQDAATARGPAGADVPAARADVARARRKAALLRGIAEVSLQGATARLERARKLQQSGLLSTVELAEAEAKVKILSLILDSGNGDGGEPRGDPKAP